MIKKALRTQPNVDANIKCKIIIVVVFVAHFGNGRKKIHQFGIL